MTSPSLAHSVPLFPCAFFHFLFAAFMEKVRVGAGVGGWVTTTTVGEEPPAWAVSRASKSGVFSSNPILSGMLVASWSTLACAGHKRW